MSVTDGKGQLGTIYDRLRKRSYRVSKIAWLNALTSGQRFIRQRFPSGEEYDQWAEIDHACYVAGVRDALNAVDQDDIAQLGALFATPEFTGAEPVWLS